MALTKVIGAGIGTVTNQFADANMSSGSVIQVVKGTTSTAVTISSTSMTDTGLEVTFTPTDHTNTFFVWFHCPNVRKTSGAGVNGWWSGRVLINGSQMDPTIGAGAFGYPENFADQRYILSGHGATSSGFQSGSNTVKLQGSAQGNGSTTWIFAHQSALSTITVMEVVK